MKKAMKLRLVGGLVLLFNLWLIGQYNLQGVLVLLLTFGFAFGYEFLIVRPLSKSNDNKELISLAPQHSPTATPRFLAGSEHEGNRVVDEQPYYEQAARELELGEVDKGLWAKCFADADGNENLTKARYIKTRVADLSVRDRAVRAAKASEVEHARQQKLKREKEIRAEKPTPDTHVRCPDCRDLIRKESKTCRFCGCKLSPQ